MQHTRPNPEMQQGSRMIFCGIKYVAIQNVGLGLIKKERKKKLVSTKHCSVVAPLRGTEC